MSSEFSVFLKVNQINNVKIYKHILKNVEKIIQY